MQILLTIGTYQGKIMKNLLLIFVIFNLIAVERPVEAKLMCKFVIKTAQNLDTDPPSLEFPRLRVDNPIWSFATGWMSSGQYNSYIDQAQSIDHFFQTISAKIQAQEIPTSYHFTKGGWDDRGLSLYLKSSATRSYKMDNGKSIYLFKTSDGIVHMFVEMDDPKTNSTVIHAVGSKKFRRHLNNWNLAKTQLMTNVDEVLGRQVHVNIDEYGTEDLVVLVNEFLMTYKQMSRGFFSSFTNSDAIEVVKTAYKYALDQKRQRGQTSMSINNSEHVQLVIDSTKELYGASGITTENAADLVYEMLTLGMSVDVMTKLFKKSYYNISGDRLYYMLFLNSMLGHIKIRNLMGESIKITEQNYEQIFDEYKEKYKIARGEVGFFTSEYAPFLFTYALYKLDDEKFEENVQNGKKLLSEIYDIVDSTKHAGALLLVSMSLKKDNDIEAVKQIAQNAKDIYKKSDNDASGSILLAEVLERDDSRSVETLTEDTSFLYNEVKLANSSTIGEAIYLARQINMGLIDVKHAMAEMHDRLYHNTSITSQNAIDILEILRLRKKIQDLDNADSQTVAEDELAEQARYSAEVVEEVIEEATNSAITTAIILTVVLNNASSSN